MLKNDLFMIEKKITLKKEIQYLNTSIKKKSHLSNSLKTTASDRPSVSDQPMWWWRWSHLILINLVNQSEIIYSKVTSSCDKIILSNIHVTPLNSTLHEENDLIDFN